MNHAAWVDRSWTKDLSFSSPSWRFSLAGQPSLKDLIKFLGIPLWGYLLLVSLGAIFFWSPMFEAIFPRLKDLDKNVQKIDTNLARIEGALSVAIPGLAHQSLSDANAEAANANVAGAAQALQNAIGLLQNAKTLKARVKPDFFETAVSLLDDLDASLIGREIAPQAHDARLVLADYRSALQPRPSLPRNATEVIETIGPKLVVAGGHLIWFGPPGQEMIRIPPPSPPRLVYVEFDGVALEGGSQTLDNAAWRQVIFLNMHLFYQGGNLILENVKFINCTFDVVRSTKARQVLDYAALDQSSLRLGLTIGLKDR
jgi:hypothetical protein